MKESRKKLLTESKNELMSGACSGLKWQLWSWRRESTRELSLLEEPWDMPCVPGYDCFGLGGRIIAQKISVKAVTYLGAVVLIIFGMSAFFLRTWKAGCLSWSFPPIALPFATIFCCCFVVVSFMPNIQPRLPAIYNQFTCNFFRVSSSFQMYF